MRVSIHGGLLFAGSNGACLPKGRSFQHQASFGVGSWEGKAPLITPNLAGADFDLKADGERRERERERVRERALNMTELPPQERKKKTPKTNCGLWTGSIYCSWTQLGWTKG